MINNIDGALKSGFIKENADGSFSLAVLCLEPQNGRQEIKQ